MKDAQEMKMEGRRQRKKGKERYFRNCMKEKKCLCRWKEDMKGNKEQQKKEGTERNENGRKMTVGKRKKNIVEKILE